MFCENVLGSDDDIVKAKNHNKFVVLQTQNVRFHAALMADILGIVGKKKMSQIGEPHKTFPTPVSQLAV